MMGTRADFYVGRGEDAEWLGSIAWDGYPHGVAATVPSGLDLLTATNEDDYRLAVARFLEGREDGTKSEQGWPWPWNDSHTTDYAYAFDAGVVYASRGGWFVVDLDADNCGELDNPAGDRPVFPDMSALKNLPPLGSPQSGVISLGGAS